MPSWNVQTLNLSYRGRWLWINGVAKPDCALWSAYNNILCTLDKVTAVFLIIGTCLTWSASWSIFVFTLRTPETDVHFQRRRPPDSGNSYAGRPQIGYRPPPPKSLNPQSDAFTQAGVVTHWTGWLLGGWIAWCNGSPCVPCSTFYWRPKGFGSEVRPPEAGSNSSSWIWKQTMFNQPSGPPYWERNKCVCWEGAILV